MTAILSWVMSIVIKASIATVLWIVIRTIIRNGGGTLKELLETAGLAIKCGCLSLRMKLTDKLRKDAEEEETVEEGTNGPGVKVEGTVV